MHPELAKLDRQLQRKGEDVILKRRVGTTNVYVSLPCRALLRGYEPKDFVGGLTEQDSKAIVSPTAIINANPAVWPGAAGGDMWPRKGDALMVQGKQRGCEAATTMIVGDEPVRIEMRVRG